MMFKRLIVGLIVAGAVVVGVRGEAGGPEVPVVEATLSTAALRGWKGLDSPRLVTPGGKVWWYRQVVMAEVPAVEDVKALIEKEYGKAEPHVSLALPILAEASGRVWFEIPRTDVVLGYDGTNFIEHKLTNGVRLQEIRFESAEGRSPTELAVEGIVFFATKEGVDVFDGKAWARQEVGAAEVRLAKEPDGKGVVAVSENLMEIKRWRKEAGGGGKAGWSDVSLIQGQEVRGNPRVKSVGVTGKGVWMVTGGADLHYAPFGESKTVQAGAEASRPVVGEFLVERPSQILTLGDGSLAISVEGYAKVGAEDVGASTKRRAVRNWARGVLRVDVADERVTVAGGDELVRRIAAGTGRPGDPISTVVVRSCDGKGIWSIAPGMRPELLDAVTLGVVGDAKFRMPTPYMAMPDGALVARVGEHTIAYNPRGKEEREELAPTTEIPNASRPVVTGDGTVWMRRGMSAGKREMQLCRYDGKETTDVPGAYVPGRIETVHVGKGALLMESEGKWVLAGATGISERMGIEALMEGHGKELKEAFVGDVASRGTMEVDAGGNLWVSGVKPGSWEQEPTLKVLCANGKWIEVTGKMEQETKVRVIGVYPVGDRSRMYLHVVAGGITGQGDRVQGYWGTVEDDEVKLKAAPSYETDVYSPREQLLASQDGGLWIVGNPWQSGRMASNAGDLFLGEKTTMARVAADGTRGKEYVGVVPVCEDAAGELWARKFDEREGAFGVLRGEEIETVRSAVWEDARLWAGTNGRVYAMFPLGIVEFVPEKGAAGGFKQGRWVVLRGGEAAGFSSRLNAFVVGTRKGNQPMVEVYRMPE